MSGTTNRNVRVTDELWTAAQATAAERGETVSDVIRAGLERYINSEVFEQPDAMPQFSDDGTGRGYLSY